jgi:hypothetical protein
LGGADPRRRSMQASLKTIPPTRAHGRFIFDTNLYCMCPSSRGRLGCRSFFRGRAAPVFVLPFVRDRVCFQKAIALYKRPSTQGFRKIRSFGLSWLTDPFLFCAFSCLLAVPFLSFVFSCLLAVPFLSFAFSSVCLWLVNHRDLKMKESECTKAPDRKSAKKLNTRKPSTGYRSLCVAGFVCVGVPCPSGRSFPSLSFPVCHCRCHI